MDWNGQKFSPELFVETEKKEEDRENLISGCGQIWEGQRESERDSEGTTVILAY